ncbi:hypothetical protein MA16_Dca024059 [Dendrobium catenatum]|uniref:Uncharacterized protein n=1 Tax=Dendrobium catenatum TaxID=906689 RepID=A0A2I0VCK5_9ASPA|nr:hypothetical protein MA16_Dca024059 [Dendrobium catenatum]
MDPKLGGNNHQCGNEWRPIHHCGSEVDRRAKSKQQGKAVYTPYPCLSGHTYAYLLC